MKPSLLALTVMLALTSISAAYASDAPNFSALLEQSRTQSPFLQEKGFDTAAAAGEARQARALRNPTIDALAENLNAPPSNGASQRQTTYTISQPLEIFGQRGARIQAGEKGLQAAEARQHQAQVEFAAALAVAYASSEAGLIRRNIAAEDVDRARGDLKAAQALVDAGKEASLRVAQAQAGLSSAEAIAASREAEAAAALEQLSVLAGRAEPYSGTSESLLVREWVAPAIANVDSASVLSAKADVDASDAVLRTERFKRAPDLNLTAGRRNFAAGGDALVVGVSLSIPLFDRNSGGISAARARSDAARARLDAARLQSQADRATALARVDAAKRGLIAASKGEEAATEAYRMARLGYEAGRTPLVELLLSRRTLTDARLSVVDARLARVAAYASLAVASGQIAFGDM